MPDGSFNRSPLVKVALIVNSNDNTHNFPMVTKAVSTIKILELATVSPDLITGVISLYY